MFSDYYNTGFDSRIAAVSAAVADFITYTDGYFKFVAELHFDYTIILRYYICVQSIIFHAAGNWKQLYSVVCTGDCIGIECDFGHRLC